MKHILFPIFLLLIVACKNDPSTGTKVEEQPTRTEPVKVPAFSKDSAYQYVAQQVAFGPRVPGTDAHQATRQWLVEKLKSTGASVIEQTFKAKTSTIGEVRAANIIASFNPTYARRVVLAAHWDTRYAADEDDQDDDKPHDGADDGGSGVGVLLEIARLLKENPIGIGVDIILFDAEDQGSTGGGNESWCLGSQHWSKNPHIQNYRAEYGILLDMVGAKGAVFRKEQLNGVFYPDKVNSIHKVYDKVWAMAKGMNKSAYFPDLKTGPVTDDHFFVNLHTDIPMIDIIYKSIENQNGFGAHWHTHDDNMSIIDPNTLGAVGQVVTAFVYNSSSTPL
jgi:Zn-dependent M28 family amino/carboxypeptidase